MLLYFTNLLYEFKCLEHVLGKNGYHTLFEYKACYKDSWISTGQKQTSIKIGHTYEIASQRDMRRWTTPPNRNKIRFAINALLD